MQTRYFILQQSAFKPGNGPGNPTDRLKGMVEAAGRLPIHLISFAALLLVGGGGMDDETVSLK